MPAEAFITLSVFLLLHLWLACYNYDQKHPPTRSRRKEIARIKQAEQQR